MLVMTWLTGGRQGSETQRERRQLDPSWGEGGSKEEPNLGKTSKDTQHSATEPDGSKETKVSKIKYLLIYPPDRS